MSVQVVPSPKPKFATEACEFFFNLRGTPIREVLTAIKNSKDAAELLGHLHIFRCEDCRFYIQRREGIMSDVEMNKLIHEAFDVNSGR